MKKTIRVKFVDFWVTFDPENHFFFRNLNNQYRFELSDDPDYVIYSCHGFEHMKYDCIRIYYTSENLVPDFNFCDYGIGFHYLDFGDRYMRIPQFSLRKNYPGLIKPQSVDRESLLNRKFCNFLFSNSTRAHPARKRFFDMLNEYKRVDSGGKYLNNMGERVNDKLSFISDYKFTIAFENSSVEGYTTEKLVDPLSVQSLPVYWGNPFVERDFNPSSFIRLNNSTDKELRKAVETVIRLDTNDDEYIRMVGEPSIMPEQFIDSANRFAEFFHHIFSQPYEEASRRASYGFNRFHQKRLERKIFKPLPGAKLVKRTKINFRKAARRLRKYVSSA